LTGLEADRAAVDVRHTSICGLVFRPGDGTMVVMSKARRFPVEVTQLPVVRCTICQRTVAYRPGQMSLVLTKHYERAHPEALGMR
jgi:hypothetical protein